ncbi:hypothetical protein NKJ48_14280 [Mesorhizobium sp. M0114]|uniref:hypothetical protein n=1 Tax=unclassified Mesorhizobium TaxID=325217 RepID=UPI0033388E52
MNIPGTARKKAQQQRLLGVGSALVHQSVINAGQNGVGIVTDTTEHNGSLTADDHQRYVEIWKTTVETQMHFNEMSVKSRQLGLTFVAAALGVALVLLTHKEDFFIEISDTVRLHVSVILIFGAAFAIHAVKGLDLNVYHKMLRGAVTFGEDFEENYMKKIFDLEKGMTQSISHYSRFSDASVCKKESGRYHYKGDRRVTAYDKIKSFYSSLLFYIYTAAFLLFIATNIPMVQNVWKFVTNSNPT